MQTTSATFAPFADVRRIDMDIRFELLDVNAKAAAVPTVNGSESVSQLTQLTDDITDMGGKYATLEPELWALDGTFDILPDSVSGIQTGWWSNILSGADKVFTTPPTLTFAFGGIAISTIGFSLFFDNKTNQYPTSIRVTTYASNGTTVINTGVYSNDGANCIINMPSSNYYSVKFEFLATSEPYRRVKLTNCAFGIVQIFNKDNLVSATLKYGATVDSSALPSRELSFTFDNTDHKYNLLNPNGLFAYLQDGQKIKSKCLIDGEAVDTGLFYYTNAQAEDEAMTATITANDLMLSLNEPVYNGGATGTWALSAAVTSILSGTGITANYGGALGSVTVNKAIPQKTTKREALRLLAQAACCSCWIDRAGVLQFKALSVGTSVDVLNADRAMSLGGISIGAKVDSVVLTIKNDYASTETVYTSGSGKNVKTVSNPCAYNGQIVADWLLACYNRRVNYKTPNRGNPAVEIGDTITIYDVYGANGNAAVTNIDLNYNGGLTATTQGVW